MCRLSIVRALAIAIAVGAFSSSGCGGKQLGCIPKAVQCTNLQPQTCDTNGVWQNSGAACAWPTPVCGGGVCSAPPSCAGLAATCGPMGNGDCCAANLVTGGTYNRSNDANYPATVSDFRLDNYEITLGRFRKFVAAYSQTMTAAGTGKNPNNASDPGWNAAWNIASLLPASAADLPPPNNGKCSGDNLTTWTDSAGGNESRPMNCINWYEAYAFCIWDGGRLPTEAEWNYAAAGGSEQRQYPWSIDIGMIDPTYASYLTDLPDCLGDGQAGCAVTDFIVVGSKSPKGDGKWGQSDLAGNVWEWVEDWYAPYTKPCNNCSNSTVPQAGDLMGGQPTRVVRGGDIFYNASKLLSSRRDQSRPRDPFAGDISSHGGARCSRAP